jgi:amino acid transporter
LTLEKSNPEGPDTKIFVRTASGLVRNISPWGALSLAFVMPGILNAFYLGMWGAGLYPTAYEPPAVLLVFLLAPVMAVFYLFSVAMPRSGGDYIYVSRTLTPVLGMVTSWTFAIVFWSWAGNVAMLMWLYGPVVDFVARGQMTGNQGLVNLGLLMASPNILFVLSTLSTIAMGVIAWRGLKATTITMYVVWIFSTLGLLAFAFIFLTMPSLDFFKTNMLKMTGVSYDSVIQLAKSNSWTGQFTILDTMYAGMVYVILNTLGNQAITTCAGEIKQVKKSTFLALFGSLALMVVYWFPQYYIAFQYPGSAFASASAYLDMIGKNPYVVEPVWSYVAAFATNNPWLVTLEAWAFWASDWAIGFGSLFFSTRAVFAWSFDRVFPSFASAVDKRGNPWGAVLIATIGCEIWTILNVYLPQYIKIVGYSVTIWMVGWVLLGLAAIVFPYRRKAIFQKSPDIVRKKIAGLPVIVYMGILTIIIGGAIAWATFVPALNGLTAFYPFVLTVVSCVVAPVIIFYAYYFYRTKFGKVPMNIQFKEIPPD